MNPSYTEIIRGEVSIFRGGAGGLSYVSSGSPRGAGRVGASWAEALVKAASESRQINGTVVEAVVDLIIELRHCVNEVFGPWNRRSDSRLVQSRTTSLALFLIQNTNLVETYLGKFLVTKLKSGFFRCSDVSGERTRLACWFRRRAETVFCLNVARLRCG